MVFGFFSRIKKAIEYGFYQWGLILADRPWVGILIAALASVALIPGITMLEMESRGEKLWVPSGTRAQSDKDYVDNETSFQSTTRLQQVIFTRPELGDNVLAPKTLDYALQVHEKILKVEFEYETADTEETISGLTYQDVCVKVGREACWFQSLLLFFASPNENGVLEYNRTAWDTEEKILNVVNSINPQTNPWGFSVNSILGAIKEENGRIVAAAAMPSNYLIQADIVIKNAEELDPRSEEFELAWMESVAEEVESIEEKDETIRVERYTSQSFADEFGKDINNDLNVLFAGIGFIVTYTFLQLSVFKKGCVGLRIVSTVGGVACIGLAIVTSQGLCAYLGLFTSALVQILPFFLVGVGVDDLFVYTNAFDNTAFDADEPDMRTRVARSMAEGGTSITITSLTNFGAFIIGSNTSLPGLRNFSIYAAFGVLFDYFFTLTLYPAFLIYDTRRQEADRYEIACCVKRPQGKEGGCCTCDNTAVVRGLMSSVNKALSVPVVKIVTVLAFLGLLAAGIYGVTKIRVEADVDNFIPKGTYLEDWYNVQDTVFNTLGADVEVYIRDIDHSDPKNWAKLEQLSDSFATNQFMAESASWFVAFRNSKQGEELTQENFYERLIEWRETEQGSDFIINDVDLLTDNDKPKPAKKQRSRFTGTFRHLEKSAEQVDAMDSIRETVDETALGLQGKAFAYSGQFLDYEQYKQIGGEALRNIGLGLAMIALVIVALLGNLLASLLTIACVVSAVVEVVGFMYFWGLNIDSVVVIFVVISLGLSVDYSAHVAHGYLSAKGTSDERRESALVDTGAAVFNGGFSTFLAIILLSTAQSFIFVVFFRAVLLAVLLGMAQGLILLPILLSWFNPGAADAGEHRLERQRSQGADRRNVELQTTGGFHEVNIEQKRLAPVQVAPPKEFV